MSTFPQITSPPQAFAEVVVNEALETLEHQAVYGKNHATTTGLTWGYHGGRWSGFAVAAGTVALTGSQPNYLVVDRSTGAVSVSTSNTNWNSAGTYARLYKIVTGAAAVTSVEDHRAGSGGVHGSSSAVALDADGTMAANSSTVAPAQSAVVTYVAAQILAQIASANVMIYKGAVDGSANPNYPAADAGWVYIVSVAGKIGGASGVDVEAGDILVCKVDATSSGNQATVGANWDVLQTNLIGAAPLASPTFTGTPTAPTAAGGTSTTQIATTAFVAAAISALTSGGGVRRVTTTTDTIVSADRGKLVSYQKASAIAASLAQAGSTGFNNVWFTFVSNLGAGTLTITPATSTINGGATLTLLAAQGALIFSDGTNYWALVIGAGSGGGGAFTYASSAPSSPSVGDRWVDSANGILYTYINDGTTSQWVEF